MYIWLLPHFCSFLRSLIVVLRHFWCKVVRLLIRLCCASSHRCRLHLYSENRDGHPCWTWNLENGFCWVHWTHSCFMVHWWNAGRCWFRLWSEKNTTENSYRWGRVNVASNERLYCSARNGIFDLVNSSKKKSHGNLQRMLVFFSVALNHNYISCVWLRRLRKKNLIEISRQTPTDTRCRWWWLIELVLSWSKIWQWDIDNFISCVSGCFSKEVVLDASSQLVIFQSHIKLWNLIFGQFITRRDDWICMD